MKFPPPISILSSRPCRCRATDRTADPRGSRSGVALVITLIMLSVITFMAVTFLVLSRRERYAAQSATDQSMARNAADSGQQRAQIEMLATILAFTNEQVVGLIVSTNYVNRFGYDHNAPVPASGSNPTNVNYFYRSDGAPFTLNDSLQNLANQFFNPRAPVFVTNRASGGTDFPYYLDLNRNGVADTNGYWPIISTNPALPYLDAGGNLTASISNAVYEYFHGDPEWIGVLEHPDSPHSSSNKFVARYAYLVVPTSHTLDANYIHNYAALGTDPNGLQFRRNMGMGSWEINLAGFLADLNTNIWAPALYSPPGFNPAYYEYQPLLSAGVGVVNGLSFTDAQSLLGFRYGGGLTPWNNVQSVQALFGASPGTPIIRTDLGDEYGGGQPYMTGTRLPTIDGDDTRYVSGWPGSDNPKHFFSPQDLFQVPGFGARLQSVGTNVDSYNRYTFYRLYSELGTDSAPDQNKMNLNYRNMANGIVVVGMETNFIPWRPLDFFTNAARKIFGQLRLPDPTDPANRRWIDVDNIPVYPINTYSPPVHRVLQLAANMYDATTSTNTPYPSIFRPVFTKRNANEIVITGYELVNAPEDTSTLGSFLTIPLDLLDPAERANIVSSPPGCNVYGLPWIIGAKKGFPNLNKVGMQTITTLSRRLLATNTAPAGSGLPRIRFTQMIEVGISNVIGVQMWNSYSNAYPRPVFIQADGFLTMLLSNVDNGFRYPSAPVKIPIGAPGYVTNFLGTGWVPPIPPVVNRQPNARSFQIPFLTNFVFVPWAEYRQVNPGFFQIPPNQTLDWSLNPQNSFPQPHWVLGVTNRLRCMIIDGGPGGRVIDYVQLSGLDSVRDLSEDAKTDDRFGMFRTNTAKFGTLDMPEGVQRQIMMALGNPPGVDQATWANYGGVGNVTDEIQKFKDYVYGNHQGNPAAIPAAQIPFTPTARQYQTLLWQANDPLVHYLASDLFFAPASNSTPISGFVIPQLTNTFFTWNGRYDPWNGRPTGTPQSDPYAYDMSVKDPSVWSSDFWDFPTNKFPGIGWLGRVHRGTPWQTVYMKSTDTTRTNLPAWRDWSGTQNDFLAQQSAPVNDWGLFDLFTTSINDNASRGKLSVNQTGLAAWSAVLSGVIALTNSGPVPEPVVIDPAGPFDPNLPSPVARIVQGINNARFFTNKVGAPVFRNSVFNHAGDVLATPELTEASPFLNTTDLHSLRATNITDEVMERIPQQIMSLLTLNHSPRFVIYAYGQTLRPADRSLYMNSGPFFRMCTNYQVTAETATRTVVRVEGSLDPRRTPAPPTGNGLGPDSFGRLYPPHIVVEQFNVLPPD